MGDDGAFQMCSVHMTTVPLPRGAFLRDSDFDRMLCVYVY